MSRQISKKSDGRKRQGGGNKAESLHERAGRGRKQPKKNAGNRRYRETIRSVFGFSRGGEDFIAFLFQGGLAEVGFFGKIFAEFGTDVFDFFFKGAEFVFQKQFIDVFAQIIDERGAFFEHIKFPKRGQRGAFGALRQLLLQFVGSRGRFGFAVQIRHGGEKVFQAGISNVRGEGKETQRNIYSFVDASEQTVALVDCENCDPLKLCAALQSMQPETLAKITKIILYNDVNASSAWGLLAKHTKATIEHQMSERVLTGKSLVDVMLVAGCCKEHYANHVNSFLLFSSDSDYWGLISSVNTAKFLVMVEQDKVSYEVVQKMVESDIPFCYLDQFCQGGQSHRMKVDALLSECKRFAGKHFESFNVKEMMNVALLQTRIELSKTEEKQFYERYLKTMRLKIEADGTVRLLITEEA